MILNKINLLIHELASIDKAIPVLNNVHITKDGSTIAANGKSIIAVSPVPSTLKENVPLYETESDPVTISSESVKEILKNIPKDILFNGLLEHCDQKNGEFIISDGKRKKKIEAKTYQKNYINYKKVFRKASLSSRIHKIVLNRKRLIKLLQTMEKICPDSSGESAVYIEFSRDNDIILRSINHSTGQRCIALMTSYAGIEGKWMEADIWEKKLTKKPRAVKKK